MLNFGFNYFLNRPQAPKTSAIHHVPSVLLKLKKTPPSGIKAKPVLYKEICAHSESILLQMMFKTGSVGQT